MAKGVPMSRTSGSRLWPLSCTMAFISSWLEPSGFSLVILMPYSFWNELMMAP